MATLLLLGFAAQAQQSQPSIEQQIKQKEAELERLREIKKRQDKVRELQDEIRRLEGGENIQPDSSHPATPEVNTTQPPVTERMSQPESSDQPNTNTPVSNPTTTNARPAAATRAFVASGPSAATADLPTLRSSVAS